MAAAISRALKLPGKKGPDLGEYDPLTQADSESEEDDLVLNYPRNGPGDSRGGLGGAGGGDAGVGGRVGRVRTREEEEEEEEEEWRGLQQKQRDPRLYQVNDPTQRQYWAQRELDGANAVLDGGPGADPESKRRSGAGAVRTGLFLGPLLCAVVVVLLCAFLTPCQQGAKDRQSRWQRELGLSAAVASHPLALWDVDNDTIADMIVGVTQPANHSTGSQGSGKVFSVVALSSVGGVTVWTAMVPEPVLWVQCGLGGAVPGGPARLPMCLSIGSTRVSALNYSTGSVLWSVSPGEVVSPAIALPDLTGDAVSDLLIATLPADQVSDLSLLLLSGASGSRIGRPVTFNLTAQGKLIGPELHLTKVGAHYILFGLGTVEAASLKDIYIQASGRPPLPRSLRQKDPSWERLRTANSSTLIHISSGSVQVDFLLPLVVGSVNCSDWALVCGGGLSVLGGGDAHTVWSIRTLPLHSRPVPGHFNGDMTLDLLVQSSPFPRVRKVQVIDGSTGRSLWEAEFSCSLPELEGVAVRTSTGQSAFLFWAGELRPTSNVSKATVSPGAPVSHRLYLLHPTYPTILLQLTETTDTPLTMAVSYVGQREDAFYMMVASRPVPGLTPAAQVVSGLGLRGAVAGGTPVWLGPPQPGSFEVNKFYKGLSFVQNQ